MRGIKLGFWICIIFIVPIFLAKIWWNNQISPVSISKETQKIVVTEGETISEVAKELKKQNLIKSEWAFKTSAHQRGLDLQIKAGTFNLSPAQSAVEILQFLANRPSENKVTLLEGWRDEEMAQKLAVQLGINEKEFTRKAKEGYMFPDTYIFPENVTVDQIIKILRDNFDKKYTDDLRQKIKNNGLTEDQGVILASIVEREARSEQVRTMVASILLKRFNIGMGLNVDAAIQYALGYQQNEKSWWKKDLNLDDLKIDSRFNTYINVGLPPTPICNPSLSSLTAVANADPQTPYLYYYHDSKGNSYYAKTLEEHNANVANHL